jgi:hypothetical protein
MHRHERECGCTGDDANDERVAEDETPGLLVERAPTCDAHRLALQRDQCEDAEAGEAQDVTRMGLERSATNDDDGRDCQVRAAPSGRRSKQCSNAE